MSQAARLRDFVAILENSRLPVPRARLLDELEVSSATFKRDLDVLRDQMHAPIKWVPGEGGQGRGYILEDKGWSSGKLGLPKAWFSASEIYALLMIHEQASHIGPGLPGAVKVVAAKSSMLKRLVFLVDSDPLVFAG